MPQLCDVSMPRNSATLTEFYYFCAAFKDSAVWARNL